MNWKLVIGLSILAALMYIVYTLYWEFGRATQPAQTYQNQIPTPVETEGFSYKKMLRELVNPSNANRKPSQAIPHAKQDLKTLEPIDQASIVWLGHSSYLITLDGVRILVDPVLSGHSSPFPFVVDSFAGSDAYTVEDLPPIDVLLISHDHYDHLDRKTVTALRHKVAHAVVPTGVDEHLKFWGYDAHKMTSLNWHESTDINGLHITATPARHFSGRALNKNQTLWASFVLKTTQHALYIGGDSGYGPHFAQIGQQYGPFDLAMLESGQYNTSWKYIHMMPEQTVQAAQDLGAKVLLPVHWGKFVLSLHDWNEPIERVTRAATTHNQALLVPLIGQKTQWQQPQIHPWWQELSRHNTTKK